VLRRKSVISFVTSGADECQLCVARRAGSWAVAVRCAGASNDAIFGWNWAGNVVYSVLPCRTLFAARRSAKYP